MKPRSGLIILALLLISCIHRNLQLPESPLLDSQATKVNIIRENRFFGFGLPLTVWFDEAVLCKLRAGEYVTFKADPGFHTLGLSASTITSSFVPNRVYYFLIKMSSDNYGFEIERIDDTMGNRLISRSEGIE